MDRLEIRIDKKLRDIALFVLFFFVITHGYRYFSPMFSHDSLAFAAESDVEWKISLGRFMQPVYWKFRGQIAAPYIVGILAYCWLTLSVYIVMDLLDVKSSVAQFLLAGSMTGSLALVCTNAAYIHESDIFMLALFLNVLATWVCLQPGKMRWLFAPALIVISTALYQAYIQVYVVLIMIWAIKRIISGNSSARVLCKCLRAALLLIAGMAAYAVIWKYILSATGIQPENGYNGLTDVGNYQNVSIIGLLRGTWEYPFQYLLGIKSRNYWMVLVPRVCILFYACYATIYVLIRQRQTVFESIAVIGITILLPAGLNCMYFISKGLIHDLIVYSYCFADVWAITVMDYACHLFLQGECLKWFGRLKKSMSAHFLCYYVLCSLIKCCMRIKFI